MRPAARTWQAIGYTRGAAGAHGDLSGAVALDRHAQHFGGTLHDETQFIVGVKLQPQQDAEPRTQRRA